jgi:hypothetical protein
MSWPYGLNPESFTFLVSRVPTIPELQAALDEQDFVSRLVLSPVEPVEVRSDTPPLYEWRGRLDGQDVAFRIGVSEPAKLPGKGKDITGVQAWPVVLWSTRSGQPDVVGAGAMALYSWAVVTGGAEVVSWSGTLKPVPDNKKNIDFILTCASGNVDRMKALYPDFVDDEPNLNGPIEITPKVHRGDPAR